jgi:pSer/pThr/pTyr-binding forkhead associated (FHA) protein
MKLSLMVMTPGKMEGKNIPITLSQFVIGRDPQCQLRPASPVISKRHCAVLVRGDKVFVRDFDSTNGTFVNDQQVKGEVELHNEDQLKIGPIAFGVKIEATPAVNKPTPTPPTKKPAADADDDSIAAMLLSLQDDTPGGSSGLSSEVPEGSTVMDIPAPAKGDGTPKEGDPGKTQQVSKPPSGNTSTAAKAILEKYMRRPRA